MLVTHTHGCLPSTIPEEHSYWLVDRYMYDPKRLTVVAGGKQVEINEAIGCTDVKWGTHLPHVIRAEGILQGDSMISGASAQPTLTAPEGAVVETAVVTEGVDPATLTTATSQGLAANPTDALRSKSIAQANTIYMDRVCGMAEQVAFKEHASALPVGRKYCEELPGHVQAHNGNKVLSLVLSHDEVASDHDARTFSCRLLQKELNMRFEALQSLDQLEDATNGDLAAAVEETVASELEAVRRKLADEKIEQAEPKMKMKRRIASKTTPKQENTDVEAASASAKDFEQYKYAPSRTLTARQGNPSLLATFCAVAIASDAINVPCPASYVAIDGGVSSQYAQTCFSPVADINFCEYSIDEARMCSINLTPGCPNNPCFPNKCSPRVQ
jgi:hypothetical protein